MSAPAFTMVEYRRHPGAKPEFVIYGPRSEVQVATCFDHGVALRLLRALNGEPDAFYAPLPSTEPF